MRKLNILQATEESPVFLFETSFLSALSLNLTPPVTITPFLQISTPKSLDPAQESNQSCNSRLLLDNGSMMVLDKSREMVELGSRDHYQSFNNETLSLTCHH